MRLLRAFSGIFLALAGATLLAMWAVFVSMDFAFGGGLPPPPSTLRDLTDFGGDYAGAYLLLLLADMLILLSVRVGPTRK